jgi:phosphoribosyl 1,2-cyclic phosphate phosphodiesterase
VSVTFTILGCGASMGVPRVALGWGACDPLNPKNLRRRCSLLVEQKNAAGQATSVLVDTGPDCRYQLIDAGVTALDGVLYTHSHADHCHGIDDVRPVFIKMRKRVDAYMDTETAALLNLRFGYCFATPDGSNYPPIMNQHIIAAGEPLTIEGEGGPVPVLPVLHHHGDIDALGFRFGDVAYSPDIIDMPDASAAALAGLDLWIVDALRYTPHPSHFTVDQALGWIERLKPKRAILTNLHTDLDFTELSGKLPDGVSVAYDGLKITV